MRRREVLRATAGAVGTGVAAGVGGAARVGGAGGRPGWAGPAGRAAAHPGPYRPYGSVELEGAKEAVVGADGTAVYVAATTGFAVVDVSRPADPSVVVERRDVLADRETGPLGGIHDVKVDGDRLAVVGPANPTGAATLHGMAVYDVADPTAPELVGFHETAFPVHNCFVRDGVAYLTGNNGQDNPLVMVDVAGDEPSEVGRWSITAEEPGWRDVAPSVWAIHDVWVQDGLAYVAHWDAGTWIVDVSDPADAAFVSRLGAYRPADLAGLSEEGNRLEGLQMPGNSHYAMVDDAGAVLAVGREAWDQDPDDDRDGGPGGIDLYDVSDPASPERLSTIAAPPSPDPSIGGVWTTSHNFDLRGGRLYTSWYRGGVKTFDVSDPAEPREIAAWRNPAHTEFWTAKRARNCFVASSRVDPSEGIPSSAAVYTFPDHPGVQPDPPPLTSTAGNESGTGGNGTGGNDSDGGFSSSPTGTTTATSTATTGAATTAGTESQAGSSPETTASGGQAGFGLAAGLAGVGLAAWRRWARE